MMSYNQYQSLTVPSLETIKQRSHDVKHFPRCRLKAWLSMSARKTSDMLFLVLFKSEMSNIDLILLYIINKKLNCILKVSS